MTKPIAQRESHLPPYHSVEQPFTSQVDLTPSNSRLPELSLVSAFVMSTCTCGRPSGRNGIALDGPFNSDMATSIACACELCTLCWQEMRNEDQTTCKCGTDVAAWLLTHYEPKYDESEASRARRQGRDVTSVTAFRDDLVHWLMANRSKTVSEVFGELLNSATAARASTAHSDILENVVFTLIPEVQMQLFVLTSDARRYGVMPYEVWRSLLAEFDSVRFYAIAVGKLATIKGGVTPINSPRTSREE